MKPGILAILVCCLLIPASARGEEPHAAPPPKPEEGVFAEVDGHTISVRALEMAVAQAARRRFYHGKPPEEEVAALRREVGNNLVNRFLIVREAKRRDIEPDWKSIETQLAQYEKQYANSETWRARRETMLPQLREQLAELGLLTRMEQEIRAGAADPPEEMARAYYAANPDKFTEPEQLRLSLILLMVDPSSPHEVWDSATAEAEGYLAKLRAGEDFAQIARRHSEDETAAQGGDLGLVHTISLPPAIQEAVKGLAPGGLSAVTRTLHGMAIVRLEERRDPYLHSFEEVAARARGLAGRDWSDRLWEEFLAKLRAQAAITINERVFMPLADQPRGEGQNP